MKKHYRRENNCLNCGTILEGHFCHNCGQENLEMKESFSHMMRHAISDYFHFDDQFFSTLKPLLFKPGKLTVEYNTGHRASYLHPVKMYIFISVIYFLLLFQTNFEPVKVEQKDDKAGAKKELTDANNRIDSTLKSPYIPAVARQALIKQQKYNNSALSKLQNDTAANNDKKDRSLYNVKVNKYADYQQYLNAQAKLPEGEQDGLFMRMFTKNMIYYHQKYGSQAKEEITKNFNHMIPKMMFLMLPLFALILKLTFRKDKKLYVEHMIYSFHLHCFVFLFFSFLILIQLTVPLNTTIMQGLLFAGSLYIIWYQYKSFRVVYHRNRFRTITKMIGVDASYFIAFMLCMCIAIGIVILFRPLPSE